MEDLTRENLETTLNDCLERADACPADSEDYFKLIQKATAIGQILNDDKKIESQKEVDLKKIEKDSQITFKDIFVIGTPIAAGGIGLLFRSWMLNRQTIRLCNFEKDYSFTTSAGRSLAQQSFRDLFNFGGKRGR